MGALVLPVAFYAILRAFFVGTPAFALLIDACGGFVVYLYCARPISEVVGTGSVQATHVDAEPFWPNEDPAGPPFARRGV